MKPAHMSKDLISAYQNTDYIVQCRSETFLLKINLVSKELNSLYQKHNEKPAAFITAFNPRSQIVSSESNTQAHAILCDISTFNNYTNYDGFGTDPTGEWEPEQSLLLIGVSFSDACQLGVDFQQNAILFAADIPIPRLILLGYVTVKCRIR